MERKKRDISPTNRWDTNDKSVAPNWDTFVECSHRVKNGKTTQKKWQQTVPTTVVVVVVFFKLMTHGCLFCTKHGFLSTLRVTNIYGSRWALLLGGQTFW